MTHQNQQKSSSKKSHKGLKFLSFLLFLAVLLFIGLSTNLIKIKGAARIYSEGDNKITIQQINFQKYAFITATGKPASGLLQLSIGTVYAMPKTGALEAGFQTIGGWDYYFTGNNLTDNAENAYQHVAASLNSGNSVIEKTITEGLKLVGKSPYAYGSGRTTATIKDNQFDCSSFVNYMYHLGGHDIWMQQFVSTSSLATTGTLETWDSKKRGDLLVTPSGNSTDTQHVAIYLGGGFILHDSASTGGVAVSRLNQIIDKSVLGNETWGELFAPGTVNREVT